MFCQNCGASIENGTKFCPDCGAKQEPAVSTPGVHSRCPDCGQALEADAVFCDNCGRRLGGQAPAPNTPRYAGSPPNRPAAPAPTAAKKSNATLILAVAIAALAVAVGFLLWRQLSGRQGRDGEPAPAEAVGAVQTQTAAPTPEPTAEITPEPVIVAEPEPTAEVVTEAEPEPTAEPTPEPEPENPPEPDEASAPLPYADSLGRPAATDFAWIPDVQSGDLTGAFLGNDELVGKWKGEIIYDGTWELVYVTIDTDGHIVIEPYQINYGEGWIDEIGEEPYRFDGAFDISSVSGAGQYGSVSLYLFLENNGVQYGVGTFSVHNEGSADVYMVRP